MSKHNINTINMYNSGGALEYIDQNKVEPETEKWERLFNYVDSQLQKDKNKRIIEEYIRNQLEEDHASDQISIKEYMDPFTGSKNK